MTPAETVIATLAAELVGIEAKLNSGLTQVKENNREMRFDLAALRQRRSEITAQIAALNQSVPMVRRILTFTPSKGL